MTDFTYNRYNDLIDAIPKGSFYEGAGIVIPFRGKNVTQMRLETGSANTTYVLYFNEKVMGEVTSDSNGNIVFSKVLPLGEVEIALLNKTSGRYQYTYVTTRDYAIWLASHAEALETVDANIQTLRNNMAIATAEADALRDVYGTPIETYNELGLSNNAYRWMLHELRLGYRNFGGYYKGLETAISAFTQVPPFGYARRLWGPNWVLNHSLFQNNNFLNRSHSLSYTTTTITGVTLDKVEPDCYPHVGPNVHLLDYSATNNTLQWRPDSVLAITTPAIPVTDGQIFLPGPPGHSRAYIVGVLGNYTIVAGSNDILYLNLDDIGTIAITLTPGSLSTAAVVTLINNALNADTRYGGTYATVASAHSITGELLLESFISILIEPGPDNAASILFGNKPGRLVLSGYDVEGIHPLSLEGSSYDVLGTGLIRLYYDYTVTPPLLRLRAGTYGSTLGAYVTITGDGVYPLVDSLGNTVNVYVTTDDLYVTTGVGNRPYYFSYNYQAYAEAIGETKGLWVTVDSTLLPAIDTSVEIILIDDTNESPAEIVETPDSWIVYAPIPGALHNFTSSAVSNGSESWLEPCQSFSYNYVAAGQRSVDFITRVSKYPLNEYLPRGSASPNVGGPGGVYDYEGYDLVVSGWVRNLTSAGLDATLTVSFDGGTTWQPGATVAVTIDTSPGYLDPTLVSYTIQIPAEVSISVADYVDSAIMVKLTALAASGDMNVILEGFTAEVKYISSRYLKNATVARTRHRQYFGELLYVWSPEALTLTEKKYLGLPHATTDRRVPISGVEITLIDPDTPTGSGVFEYEYNKTVPTYRLRWTPSGTTWAPGAGWTYVTADGSFTLTAPDASTMVVYVTFSLLPILSGTAPVVKSSTITISSSRSDQGHSRKISPAHSSIDIFDVTEYDTNGDPINLLGVISEADFSLCTQLNTDIYSTDPFKFSYCYPVLTNSKGESLTFVSAGADYDADLDYDSDQNVLTTVIYEDGIPLPNDKWAYVDSNTVRIVGASYVGSAVYTIDYNVICQVTSPYIDMGLLRANYSWWADYLLWERFESEKGEFEATVPVFFNLNTGRAYLDRRSTRDLNSSRLYVISGNRTEERTIPKRYWSFVDDFTITIDVSQLQSGQFYLTHNEKRVYEESILDVTFEHRHGATTVDCSTAAWVEVEKNENVSVTDRFHQLRMTISGMTDVRDFRLRSMVLKGLHLHGANPSVPSMTDLWG